MPQPTSSIVIEFYKSKDATGNAFNRKDYYVQINLDDNYINIPGVCTAGRCEWDTFAAHLEKRLFKEMPLAKKCFSHLNIVNPPDNRVESAPWWLAIVISLPLAIITIAVIKIVLIKRDKKKREILEKAEAKQGSK